MPDSPAKTLFACACIFGAGAVYFSLDDDKTISVAQLLTQTTGVETQAAKPEPAPRPAARKAAAPQSASVVSIPRQQGQFFTQGRVNRGSVRFLIDTGASAVALTLEDAKRAGLHSRALKFSVPVQTANGTTYAAAVRLDEVRIGGIVLRDVDALVVPNGLHISLLGMSFLGELQKVEATPRQLILRL